jgi:pimeloyl-ACP methyl ester carboxylesterase
LTVLLLHAFPLDARMWEETRARLEQAGYAVAAPDLPSAPEIGVEAWARHVLASVAGDIVPVGISMGGYLAFELWRQAPERIRALVLADTKAGADTPQARQARDDTILLLGEGGFDPFWEALAPKLFARAASPDVVESARAIASEQPLTELVTALETLRDRPDSHATLPTIHVPVLVVVGEEDELTPQSDADELEEQIRRARLVRVSGAGHLTPLERPEEFNDALLAFLQEVAS